MTNTQRFLWLTPFLLQTTDANAWGLITHVYYAHSLVWAMPLLDPRVQAAIKRFPELVMTGAVLPDLAVVNHRFKESHQWHHAHQLLAKAKSDEQVALAIGYASHLYVDVIAHNHFVPAHEATWLQGFKRKPITKLKGRNKRFNISFKPNKWLNHSAITHILSEWAMDSHLHPLVKQSPSQLLRENKQEVEKFIGQHFHHERANITQSINRLEFWDGVLRTSKLPQFIYWVAKRFDKNLFKHFVYYIAKTQTAMFDFGQAIAGNSPRYAAELKGLNKEEEHTLQKQCIADLQLEHPLPIHYYATKETEIASKPLM